MRGKSNFTPFGDGPVRVWWRMRRISLDISLVWEAGRLYSPFSRGCTKPLKGRERGWSTPSMISLTMLLKAADLLSLPYTSLAVLDLISHSGSPLYLVPTSAMSASTAFPNFAFRIMVSDLQHMPSGPGADPFLVFGRSPSIIRCISR